MPVAYWGSKVKPLQSEFLEIWQLLVTPLSWVFLEGAGLSL